MKRWPSAAALVAAIRRGEPGAESVLVLKYGPGLMYVLQREAQDRDTAEDLYQESMLIVIERLRTRSIEQPERLAGFLLGVARHLLKAHRRAETRFVDEWNAIEGTEDSSPTPCEHAILFEEAKAVRAAIERLAVPRDRDLLRRRYLFEEDKQVICDELGLEPQQFNSVIHRAKSRLKRQISTAWQCGPEIHFGEQAR